MISLTCFFIKIIYLAFWNPNESYNLLFQIHSTVLFSGVHLFWVFLFFFSIFFFWRFLHLILDLTDFFLSFSFPLLLRPSKWAFYFAYQMLYFFFTKCFCSVISACSFPNSVPTFSHVLLTILFNCFFYLLKHIQYFPSLTGSYSCFGL